MKRLKLIKIFLIVISMMLISCSTADTKSASALSEVTAETGVSSDATQAMTTSVSAIDKTIINATESAASTQIVDSIDTNTVFEAPINEQATGGDFSFAYYYKIAKPHSNFIPQDLYDKYVAWSQSVWAEKNYNYAKGSFYDYIHEFNISEDYFREQNKNILEPFTEEEIHDLFYLTKEEFNLKYVEPYYIIKGENIYRAFDLMTLSDKELATTGVTREEVSAEIDKFYLEDPEMAEWYRQKYGY